MATAATFHGDVAMYGATFDGGDIEQTGPTVCYEVNPPTTRFLNSEP